MVSIRRPQQYSVDRGPGTLVTTVVITRCGTRKATWSAAASTEGGSTSASSVTASPVSASPEALSRRIRALISWRRSTGSAISTGR